MDKARLHNLVKNLIARSVSSEPDSGDYRFVIGDFGFYGDEVCSDKYPRTELSLFSDGELGGGLATVTLNFSAEKRVVLSFNADGDSGYEESEKTFARMQLADVETYVQDLEQALSRPQNEEVGLRMTNTLCLADIEEADILGEGSSPGDPLGEELEGIVGIDFKCGCSSNMNAKTKPPTFEFGINCQAHRPSRV